MPLCQMGERYHRSGGYILLEQAASQIAKCITTFCVDTSHALQGMVVDFKADNSKRI
jgi:hypothetical protein